MPIPIGKRAFSEDRVQFLNPGRTGQSLRSEQGEGGEGAAIIRLGDWCVCSNLPFEELVREVVPPQLQLSYGDLLPQHREGSANFGFRAGPRGGDELRGRRSVGISCGNRWATGWRRGSRRDSKLPYSTRRPGRQNPGV